MKIGDPVYITTTLPYVNAEPHIGFALEIVQADAVARFQRLCGKTVFFNFGTDEHGQKIYQKAMEKNLDPKTYCDQYALKFDNLKGALSLSYSNFIRTTDPHHIHAAQEFWMKSKASGDIYKKSYKAKYCVGCELEKTDSELVDGVCPLHPNRTIEIIEEENYFFRFSQYQQKLLKLYERDGQWILPDTRKKEIHAFVSKGLTDFSISRLKKKMPWGIPVPDDPDHVMYVWFDALINYVSAIGWPDDHKTFNTWWPVIQFAGKDNLRQQAAIWQAMLLSAGLPPSKQIFIHGFISSNGQKMSKSLGNVVDPYHLVKQYGTDAVRYYLLSAVHPYEDSDFTYEKFEHVYNSDLAHGLGNLVARIAKLAESISYFSKSEPAPAVDQNIVEPMLTYRFDHALSYLWNKIKTLDTTIEHEKPWTMDQKTLEAFLGKTVPVIQHIAFNLHPFLPDASKTILAQFHAAVRTRPPLFPRIENIHNG